MHKRSSRKEQNRMIKVFIDGKSGTTGLRIYDRLNLRSDVTVITLSEEVRHDPEARREAIKSADAAFFCLPDDAARESAGLAGDSDTVILDTSTAHRTAPGWCYGFPELSPEREAEVRASKRIAVPGCHASGFCALVAPLTQTGIIKKDAHLSAFSLTGYSGGGKKMIAEYESADRGGLLSFPRQYALTQKHKHLPEMMEVCSLENAPAFIPVVADFYSGMEVTVPVFASELNGSIENIKEVYRSLYSGGIVKYADASDEGGFLSAGAFEGSDAMEISVFGNDERILLCARYDNLGKGASGAAIECMNLALGLEASKGLSL